MGNRQVDLDIAFSNRALQEAWTVPENSDIHISDNAYEIIHLCPDYYIILSEETDQIDSSLFKLTRVIADCAEKHLTDFEIRDLYRKGVHDVILNNSERALNAKPRIPDLLHSKTLNDFIFSDIVAVSKPMQKLFNDIRKISNSLATALIRGESGVGKELVARAIHSESNRHNHPFVAVNCAAIPETLLEDELFGHVKGAFTDARENRKGRFEEADGGVLFLDEIGDMPLMLQVKLLRAIQEREIQPLGSNKIKKVDVRILAATASNLEEKIKKGEFRDDLYYRLNVIPVEIPPLRDRKEDIPVLVYYFIEKINEKYNSPLVQISPSAMRKLKSYSWPGNIRELENYVERIIVLHSGQEQIEETDLMPPVSEVSDPEFFKTDDFPEEGLPFDSIVSSLERELILKSLEKTGGNKKKAAELLNLKRTTFIEKVKKLKEDENVNE